MCSTDLAGGSAKEFQGEKTPCISVVHPVLQKAEFLCMDNNLTYVLEPHAGRGRSKTQRL